MVKYFLGLVCWIEFFFWLEFLVTIFFRLPRLAQGDSLFLVVQLSIYDFSTRKHIYVLSMLEVGFNELSQNFLQRIEYSNADHSNVGMMALWGVLVVIYMWNWNQFLIENTTVMNTQNLLCEFAYL